MTLKVALYVAKPRAVTRTDTLEAERTSAKYA
jgi:hypothetical protein